MWGRTVHFIAALLVASFVIACDATKSSNPLSPSVAGPMPGVAITAPKLLEPNNGWELDHNAQPVRLMLENSSSNGPRPVTYIFELASDAGFGNVVFSRGGVAPGDEGRTSIQLTDRLPTGVPFFWRAKAEDGANVSAYSAPVSFSVITPVLIDMPVPLSPVGATEIDTNQPTFRMRNPARSGPAGALVYQLQVGPHEAFANPIAVYQIGEQPGETQFDAPLQLPFSQLFFWRVRSFDTGSSGVVGPWSAAQPFRTGTAPAAPLPGGGGGSPGNPCTRELAAWNRSVPAQPARTHGQKRNRGVPSRRRQGSQRSWNRRRAIRASAERLRQPVRRVFLRHHLRGPRHRAAAVGRPQRLGWCSGACLERARDMATYSRRRLRDSISLKAEVSSLKRSLET